MIKKKKLGPAFLRRLSRLIYDPSKRTFLRLCTGTLKNGPDPTNADRPMHCGLGELYFAMTGKQPSDRISEQDVAAKFCSRAGIRKGNLRDEVRAALNDVIGVNDHDTSCSRAGYVARSRRVAKQFLTVANFLEVAKK